VRPGEVFAGLIMASGPGALFRIGTSISAHAELYVPITATSLRASA
jgi:hypothetical protein